MIRTKKYRTMAASAGLLGSLLAGCTETEEVRVADLYQKAYVTTDIYPQTEGLYTFTRTISGPSLAIENGRLTVKPGGDESTSFDGLKRYEIYFRTLYAVAADLTGRMVVPDNAEELIAAYNAENGLAGEEAYVLLAPANYALSNPTSTIGAGRKEGGEPFVVEFDDNVGSLAAGNYLLPLVCELPEGAGVPMSEKQSCIYLKFHSLVVDERQSAEAERIARERILYHNTDFTYEVGSGSSFYSEPYSDAALFNDSVNDVCFCSYVQSSLTITFDEPVGLSRMGLALYNSNSYRSIIYCWISWSYDDGTSESINSWLTTPTYSSPSMFWVDLSEEYLDDSKKVVSFDFTIYNNGYNFSEIYFVAFDE